MSCSIIPPHILRNIAAHGDDDDRTRARTARIERVEAQPSPQAAAPRKRRAIFDARNHRDLPGKLVRSEGQRRTRDDAVNEAYDGSGRTIEYFRRVHGGTFLYDVHSTVHYGTRFDNAQWNGRQMIYGDGDGKYFNRFTASLEVIAHELTHGINQLTARLGYSGQAGALNEHFADVFGSLVKQHTFKQTAATADWLIGTGLLTSRVHGEAIRSMKSPGTAYDDPILGKDPQPAHVRNYVRMEADSGGVHVNSGIPNHAFYRVAMLLGGPSWKVAGRIWYATLTKKLAPRARFQQCADATWTTAGELYGIGSEPQSAVLTAWRAVGIDITGPRLRIKRPRTHESFAMPVAGAELPF